MHAKVLQMDTTKLATFIAAAEAGSLSVAAIRLGAQLSTVSRKISELEKTIGAELLVRTGRGVRPTPAGEKFLERAHRIIREVEAAAAEARGEQSPSLARLKLSAPFDLSLQLLPRPLALLSQRYPNLSIEAYSEARKVSLAEDDYDAVLRLGPLKDSRLLARRLGAFSMVLCARPNVAEAIKTPSALPAKEFILLLGGRNVTRVIYRGQESTLHLNGRCRVGTFIEAAELAANTDDLVVLPGPVAAPLIAARRLARVIPKLSLPRVEINLLHLPQHRGSCVIQGLFELLLQELERLEHLAEPSKK
jgi:DNA-binding transcriptional LysR family regulator